MSRQHWKSSLADPPIPQPRRRQHWKSSFRRSFVYHGDHGRVFAWAVKHLRRQYKPANTLQLARARAWLRTRPLPALPVWRDILRGSYRVPVAQASAVTTKQYSDAYECPECGVRNVQYTQMQTRSADEGMTSFCQCMSCLHRWKEN
jgi:DNA-directed RNA polymerase subunit M/transcription elongation factor TFIIS